MSNNAPSPHRDLDLEPPDASGANELAAVFQAAATAAPAWAATAEPERAAVLEALADALTGATDELVSVADRETALGETRLRGEVARTTGQLRMFADLIQRGQHIDAIISEGDPAAGKPDVRRISIPVGPVAVFSASNFPFAFSVAGGDTASALAAGCPVVVKAHEGHPLTSALTTKCSSRHLRQRARQRACSRRSTVWRRAGSSSRHRRSRRLASPVRYAAARR